MDELILVSALSNLCSQCILHQHYDNRK